MGKGAGTQTGVIRKYTDPSEVTSPSLKDCPNCQVKAVPRGITSTHVGATGTKHCPNCGHVYGRNSLFDRKVRHITVTGAAGATTITVDGGTLQMSAAILPDYADSQGVAWSAVAGTAVGTTIDADTGLLTAGAGAGANGTVTVVATAKDGSGTKGERVITLSNQT